MKVEYDPKCEELARWFLDDEPQGGLYDERLIDDLAGVIQVAIEEWLENQETGAAGGEA